MRISWISAVVLSFSTTVLSQRPSETSICDYYTNSLLHDNSADSQYTVLTLLVNTVVIGNYTPNATVNVPGILAKGTFNGTDVNLLPYFDGSMASSNRGGSSGVSINFLDDGGAQPLMQNQPAAGTQSNQYSFGALLGCSKYGSTDFPAYSGFPSMGAVHKFMNLDQNQLGYFITQVGLAAASFGVANEDIQTVAMALHCVRISLRSPTTIIPAQGPQLQSICEADSCPLAANATCAAYSASASASASSTPSTSMGGTAATPSSNASVTMSSATPSAFMGDASMSRRCEWSLAVGIVAAVFAALL